MKKLLIRLDDITPDMNWERFEQARAIFEKYQIKPIIGVVPDNRDPNLSVDAAREDFWERIKDLQKRGWIIAQHGYQHTYVTKKTGLLGINPFSEFAGLPYEQQYKKLLSGWEILHKQGICAKMFMAPGHTYDRNTLKALKALGFTAVTDGYSKNVYRYMGLVFIPCTLSSPRIPGGIDTLCLHVNHMGREEFEELERFCEKQIGIIGSAYELTDTEPPKRGIGTALEERRSLALRRVKRFAADNPVMQQYFARTDCDDPGKKRRKRILGLPGLLVHLLFRRNDR